MIITIDGPVASGKSTVAQLIAKDLSIYYLCSGYLYRALAHILYSSQGRSYEKISELSIEEITDIFNPSTVTYSYNTEKKVEVIYEGNNLVPFLKTHTLDKASSVISAYTNVRDALLLYQRMLGEKNSLIIEGRDCGTVVFPHAQFKFFLIADLPVRVARWRTDQLKFGNIFSEQEATNILQERDDRDSTRPHSPCKPASDAFIIDNSFLTLEQTAFAIINKCTNKKSA